MEARPDTSAARRPPRRHLRAVPDAPPPARCPSCRTVLDDWAIEVARVERAGLDCRGCGAVLV